MANKTLKASVLVLAGVAIAIQFIQPDRANPPADPAASFEVVAKPSPQAAAVIQRACQDCHSHRTVWPLYSRLAPVSWLVYADVQEGRRRVNFSEWSGGFHRGVDEIAGIIQEGEMPPAQYLLVHPDANLSTVEKQSLISGLQKSIP